MQLGNSALNELVLNGGGTAGSVAASAAVFPDIIGDTLEETPAYQTLIIPLGDRPSAQSHRKTLRPRTSFRMSWTLLEQSELEQILDHLALVGGDPFTWFHWRSGRTWRWVPMGTGDGTSLAFDVPGKETTGLTVIQNGTTVAGGSVTSSGGTDGRDLVTLSSAPPLGTRLAATFTGRRAFLVTHPDVRAVRWSRDVQTGLYNVSLALESWRDEGAAA